MQYTYLQAGPTYDATMDIHMRVLRSVVCHVFALNEIYSKMEERGWRECVHNGISDL